MGTAVRTHAEHVLAVKSIAARTTDTRRSSSSPPDESRHISWTLVDLERYEVCSGPEVVGFVDVVGRVFVGLVGDRYDRAIEIAQSLEFHAAISAVAAGSRQETADD